MSRSLVRIAHRGGGTLAPENSLEGIERSLGFGLEMIEVDVRRTVDGELVLSHLETAGSSQMQISASTLGELRGSPDAPIATLDEALDAVRGRAMLNLDVKAPGVAERLTGTLRSHDAVDACIVTCLNREWLAEISSLEPGLTILFSYPPDYGGASERPWMTPVVDAAALFMRLSLPYRLPGMLRPLPGAGASIWYRAVSQRLVAVAGRLGVPLYIWSVDDPNEMERFVAMGVDGLTSNRPDLLAQIEQG